MVLIVGGRRGVFVHLGFYKFMTMLTIRRPVNGFVLLLLSISLINHCFYGFRIVGLWGNMVVSRFASSLLDTLAIRPCFWKTYI